MGMFDWYDPVPPVPCPECGGRLEWQGKDGPDLLLVWRQGSAHPVDQQMDEETRLPPEGLADITLPDSFEILGWCERDHKVAGTGHCEEGVWTSLATRPHTPPRLPSPLRRR